MKFLSRKWHGIPLGAIFVLLMVGVGLCAYVVGTVSENTDIVESITVTSPTGAATLIYPGQSTTFSFQVKNKAPVDYTITYTCTNTAGDDASITSFKLNNVEQLDELNGPDNDVDVYDKVTANIAAGGTPGGTQNVVVTVTADKDAKVPRGAGGATTVDVGFDVARS